MPNWCNNSITIEGPADKVKALWDAANATEGGFLLEAMVPIGEWDYDTAVESWGTKWDLNPEGLEFVPGDNGRAMITGWTDSAWNPPIQAFQKYANENPDVYLEIKYFEPGVSFIGVWDSEGGDAYWEDVGALLETTEEEDAVLYELLKEFDAWSRYETDDEDGNETE